MDESKPGADAWTREALRLNTRYQLEIVEAFNLCPWAARARLDNHTLQRVLLNDEPDTNAVLELIDSIAAEKHVEVAFAIFPRLQLSRPDFDAFVSKIVNLDAERRHLESSPFALAGFHPEAPVDLRKPELLIPFLRRTPDPTIQLVRVTALERVRRGDSEGTSFMDPSTLDFSAPPKPSKASLRERIAKTNLETVERDGVQAVQARLDDILADRERSYRALQPPRTSGV